MPIVSLPRRCARLGLTLSLGALSACSPALDWREVRPTETPGLRALFPCKPDHVTRTVTLPSAPQPLVMHMWSCQTGEVTWALSQVQVQDVAQVGPTLAALPRLMQDNLQAASQMAGSQAPIGVVPLGPVQVRGMTPQAQAQGWRFQARRVDGWGRPLEMGVTAWHFAHGLQIFQASVSRPIGSAGTEPATAAQDAELSFRDGFQFPA
jgi:hypothetical protein